MINVPTPIIVDTWLGPKPPEVLKLEEAGYSCLLSKNKKELLQIIDQPIYTSELVKSVYPNGLYIDELRTYSIWVKDCDYQYIVLRKNGWQDFSIENASKPSLIERVKGKLKKGS